MNKLIIFSFILGLTGCFSKVDLPECSTIADCPVSYNSCIEGLCFKDTPECGSIDNDGCCTSAGDRGHDRDCQIVGPDLRQGNHILNFGPLSATDTALYVEGKNKDSLILFRVDSKGTVKTYNTDIKTEVFKPAPAGDHCLFPTGKGFVLWGKNGTLQKKDLSIQRATGFSGAQGEYFYGGSKGGPLYSIDLQGNHVIVPTSAIKTDDFYTLIQKDLGMLILCDFNLCTFFDITSTPANPSFMFKGNLEIPLSGRPYVSGHTLWVPTDKTVDIYAVKANSIQRSISVPFTGKPVISGVVGGEVLVIDNGKAFILNKEGQKHGVSSKQSWQSGITACGGVMLMSRDTVSLYTLALDQRWWQGLASGDQSIQFNPESGVAKWGKRLAFISQAGLVMEIPLSCK